MRAKTFAYITAAFLGISICHKVIYHFQEKVRFALLPVVRDYQLSWLLDAIIALEVMLLCLLLFRSTRHTAVYSVATYFSVHLAALAYQKFFTTCNECYYHSNMTGETINYSITFYAAALAATILAFSPAQSDTTTMQTRTTPAPLHKS